MTAVGAEAPAQPGAGLLTNERTIEALAAPLDLADPVAVFGAVFDLLDEEVSVYPTENYYYFRLWAAGKEVWGSLALPARSRDEGVLSFGYRAVGGGSPPIGGGALLGPGDGVAVRAVSELVYDVRFDGRTVRFRLNPTVLADSRDVPLAPGERYVGPVVDESGLAFHLLFDEAHGHLFLILDEREPVPEAFRAEAGGTLFGERTGFAFRAEGSPHRKILVGVAGPHVLANDWYDGPFDQMPDNAIGLGRIPDYQRLVEASYPASRGAIDRFGYYVDEAGARVAVAPYLVYFDEAELRARLDSCPGPPSTSSFRVCATRPGFIPPTSPASGPVARWESGS